MKHTSCVWSAIVNIIALTLCLSACGGDSDPVTLSFQVDVIDFLTQDPSEGVDVCLLDAGGNICQTTDADGQAILTEVPGNSDVTFSFAKSGYVTVEWPITTTEVNLVFPGTMVDNGSTDGQYGMFGLTRDPAKGVLGFNVGNGDGVTANDVAGVSVSLAPDSAEATFYAGDNGMFDDELTATTVYGSGGMVNIPPGDYTVTFTGLPDGCFTVFGHNADPASQSVGIKADVTTWLMLECP